jgi:N-acetylglucosamine malate deacetylase 2
MVVYCTDGAPEDPWFWKKYSSRETYAEARRKESLRALSIAGVKGVSFLSNSNPDDFRDQKLHEVLPAAIDSVDRLIRWYAPDSIVTTAYEGGHPDHDCCAFISSVVGAAHNVPVWEFPLYHRSATGEMTFQLFLKLNSTESALKPSRSEKNRKSDMLACYRSQPDLDNFVVNEMEWFRPQEAYDFTEPPAQLINYEMWGWKMRATELCCRFNKFTDWMHLPMHPRTSSHQLAVANVHQET